MSIMAESADRRWAMRQPAPIISRKRAIVSIAPNKSVELVMARDAIDAVPFAMRCGATP